LFAQPVYRVGENRQPVSEMCPPGIGRITEISEGDFRMGSEERPVTASLIPQPLLGLGRDGKEV
jgi:hypothetical protein